MASETEDLEALLRFCDFEGTVDSEQTGVGDLQIGNLSLVLSMLRRTFRSIFACCTISASSPSNSTAFTPFDRSDGSATPLTPLMASPRLPPFAMLSLALPVDSVTRLSSLPFDC